MYAYAMVAGKEIRQSGMTEEGEVFDCWELVCGEIPVPRI